MRPLLAVCAFAVCGLAAEPSAPAGSVKSVPDSRGSSLFYYVGTYGENIEVPYGWAAEAELRDGKEFVRFHRKSQDDFGFKPFQPKTSDYQPANFARLGLMELVVIPKNAPGGPRSLKALRRTEQIELSRQGVEFRTFDETNDYTWPRGSFHLVTSKPYRVSRTYGESPDEIYVLTVGVRSKGESGLSEARILEYDQAGTEAEASLRLHLMAVHKQTLGESLFYFQDGSGRDLFSMFKVALRTEDTRHEREYGRLISAYQAGDDKRILELKAGKFDDDYPPYVKLMGALGGMLALLSLWPAKTSRTRRARLFGRSLLFFSFLAGSAEFLVVYIPARFYDAVWTYQELALLIPVLFIPGISWMAARRLGSAHPKRVFISTSALAAIWTALMAWGPHSKSMDIVSITIFFNTLALMLVGMLFGLAFAIAFGPPSEIAASSDANSAVKAV